MVCKLLASAALVLLCAALAQATSRWSLEIDEQGRHLLQAAKSSNCTRIDAHCAQCRNQRIPGTRRSELLCSTCESGYRLRRDGMSKTCGKLLHGTPLMLSSTAPNSNHQQQQQQLRILLCSHATSSHQHTTLQLSCCIILPPCL
jgi:hypothetical protein